VGICRQARVIRRFPYRHGTAKRRRSHVESGRQFDDAGRTFPAGTFIVPPSDPARKILAGQSKKTESGSQIGAMPQSRVCGLKPANEIGLIKPPGNMPAGWLMWMFEPSQGELPDRPGDDYDHLADTFDRS